MKNIPGIPFEFPFFFFFNPKQPREREFIRISLNDNHTPPFPSKSQISIPLRLAHPCSFRLPSGYSPSPFDPTPPLPLIPLPPHPGVHQPPLLPSLPPPLPSKPWTTFSRAGGVSTDKTHVHRCTCVYRNTARGGTSRGRRAPGARRTANNPRILSQRFFQHRSFVFSLFFSQRNESISRKIFFVPMRMGEFI